MAACEHTVPAFVHCPRETETEGGFGVGVAGWQRERVEDWGLVGDDVGVCGCVGCKFPCVTMRQRWSRVRKLEATGTFVCRTGGVFREKKILNILET